MSAQLAQPIGAISNALADTVGGEMVAPTVKHIPGDRIRPDPEQPRRCVPQEGPEWEGLLASVSKYGVLQPILVRPDAGRRGHYILVCGERRWRAAQLAGHQHIAARVLSNPHTLADTAAIQLEENALREGLCPLDELEACVRFLAAGTSKGELAQHLGVSNGLVSQILKLDALAPQVRQTVRSSGRRFSRRELGRIAMGRDSGEQLALLRKALTGRRDAADCDPSKPTPRTIAGPGYRCTLSISPRRQDTTGDSPDRSDLDIRISGHADYREVVRHLELLTERLVNHIHEDGPVCGESMAAVARAS